jgi:hypothetical protein
MKIFKPVLTPAPSLSTDTHTKNGHEQNGDMEIHMNNNTDTFCNCFADKNTQHEWTHLKVATLKQIPRGNL